MKSYESIQVKFVILHKPSFQKPFFGFLRAIYGNALLFFVTFDAFFLKHFLLRLALLFPVCFPIFSYK